MKRILVILTFVAVWLLQACGSSPDLTELTKQSIAATQQDLRLLSDAISGGEIRNVQILKKYADVIVQQKPELADLARELAREGSTEGGIYRNLKRRLDEVSDLSENSLSQAVFPTMQDRLDELTAIRSAASPAMFNDVLSDPINVLADLSNGNLARVNAISQEQEMLANDGAQSRTGSQLVGNPNYGQWRQSSAGGSFWEWYGKYALFSSLIGGGPWYYGDWSRRRGYSYYHDVGRYNYTSPQQKINQGFLEQKTRKQFNRSGQKFQSPYAKKRVGASGLSRRSQAQSKKVFTSPYSKQKKSLKTSSSRSSSRYSSSYGGSSRNNYSRTSRGLSFGK